MRRALTFIAGLMPKTIFAVAVLLLSLSFFASRAAAQASELEKGPAPPPEESTPAQPKPAEPSTPNQPAPPAERRVLTIPTAPEPAKPAWDPLAASKSVDVGVFYMKKGDYDAAIARFQDASRLQPELAKPYLLLGESYEKKDELPSAIDAYKKYLDVYRTAPDRQTILKRIEKLKARADGEAPRS